MKIRIILFALTGLLNTTSIQAQTINTIAGNGVVAYSGDGGPATLASLKPQGIAEDRYGNIYFSDDFSHRIRKISTSGIITTVAGNGSTTYSGDGMAATATAINPTGIAVDTFGNLYVADNGNQRIRKVNTSGIISTIAGNGIAGFSGDGSTAISAMIRNPYYIILDAAGNIYFSGDNRVRKINTSGIISTLAGNGAMTYSGDGVMATLGGVAAMGIAIDVSGNLYIADKINNRIRKVNTAGIISTFAGIGILGSLGDGGPATSARLYAPYGIAFDSLGNLYITDYSNYKIRKVNTSGIISTFAGTGVAGFLGDGGPATSAKISLSTGITTDYYGVIFSDNGNNRVRRVCFGNTTPSISISGIDTVCSGTPVSFTSYITGGGTSPTYQWQVNGINVGTGSTFSYTPLNGDVVKCILTSNATCSFPDTAVSSTITMVVNPVVTPSISISASATNVCTGTSVSFTSTITGGGTSPAYQWKVNGVSMGTGSLYSYIPSNGDIVICTLTSSAACATPDTVTSASIIMTVNPVLVPTISISTPATTICAGTMETFVSSISNGGTSPVYQWKVNGLNVGIASNYLYLPLNGDNINCSLTSNATCATPATVVSSSVSMIVNSVPTTYSVTGSGTYFDTGIITLSNSQVGVTYQLYNGSSAYGLPMAGSGSVLTFYVTTSGTYSIVATETLGGCTDTMASSANMIINPSIVPNLNEPTRARIYPNPANDQLNIEDPQLCEIQIMDVTGRVLISKSCYAAKFTIDIASLKSGLYLVKLNGQYVQKFIKE